MSDLWQRHRRTIIEQLIEARLVHWLENVEDDPHRMRTACRMLVCGKTEWQSPHTNELLDPNRLAVYPVTCSECLAAIEKQREGTRDERA